MQEICQIIISLKPSILEWGKRFFNALPIYAAITDAQQKHDVFFALIEYMARENPGSKIDFIYQMLKEWNERENIF